MPVAKATLESYVHRHAWLLYSSLALFTVELLRSSSSGGEEVGGVCGRMVDEDYAKGARRLYTHYCGSLMSNIVSGQILSAAVR